MKFDLTKRCLRVYTSSISTKLSRPVGVFQIPEIFNPSTPSTIFLTSSSVLCLEPILLTVSLAKLRSGVSDLYAHGYVHPNECAARVGPSSGNCNCESHLHCCGHGDNGCLPAHSTPHVCCLYYQWEMFPPCLACWPCWLEPCIHFAAMHAHAQYIAFFVFTTKGRVLKQFRFPPWIYKAKSPCMSVSGRRRLLWARHR